MTTPSHILPSQGNALGSTEPSDPLSLRCSPPLPSEVTIIVTASQRGRFLPGATRSCDQRPGLDLDLALSGLFLIPWQ